MTTMEMPKPTEHHRVLARLAGDWKGDETISDSPMGPGGPAVGTVKNRSILDGFYVVQDYSQERDGSVAFGGHGVFGFDAQAGEYTIHWFDSFGSSQEFRGTYADGVMTLVNETPGMGFFRVTYDLTAEDSYGFRMEVSPDGNGWYPFMEGTYVRA